jgi:hypothetical protein
MSIPQTTQKIHSCIDLHMGQLALYIRIAIFLLND